MYKHCLLFLFITMMIAPFRADLQAHDKDSLLLQIEQLPGDDIGHLHAKALLANEYLRQDLDTAGILLRESSSLVYSHEYPEARADWLSFSGAYNWYRDNRDSALVNYRILYAMDHPEITAKRAAAAVNLAALFRMRLLGDSALYYFSIARTLFTEVGDSAGIAHADYSLASKYYRQDNFDMAFEYALRAYDYRKKRQDTFDLIYTHNMLGTINQRLGDQDKSLEHYKKSLDLIAFHPNHPARHSTYNGLSSLMAFRVGDFESALHYSQLAIDLAKERGRFDDLYVIYHNHGKIHTAQGNYSQALDYHKRADDLYHDGIIEEIRAGSQTAKGEAYKGLGNYQRARELFQDALQAATRGKALSRVQEANNRMFELDSLEGNYLSAIAHLQAAHKAHDEIWEKDRTRRIAELRIIHETAQIEAENKVLQESNRLKEAVIENQRRFLLASVGVIVLVLLLLLTILWSRRKLKKKNDELEEMHKRLIEKQFKITRQNRILDQQKQELEELNSTKDKFFSIVAHDLRGPFTALLGLVNILMDDDQQLSDEEKKDMLNSLKKTSSNAYDLTVNLLEWAKLQKNSVSVIPVTLSLSEKVDQVLESLDFNMQKKELEVSNQVPDMQVGTDPNIMQSILTNLINNAIKFTPRGGRIVIEAKRLAQDRVEVCVTDTGIGIEEDKLGSLFEMASTYRNPGTEGETGTGLGLMTTKEFVELLGGKIEVTSEINQGSRFCFTITDHGTENSA